LTEIEKRNHIVSIGANRPETKNILRIVETYPAIEVEIAALKKADAMQLATSYSLAASYQKISNNWGMSFMMWLPEELKPKSSFVTYQWDLRMVALIAIFAKATPGQGHITKGILKTIVDAQTNVGIPTVPDVMQAITLIYERAGLVALQVCSSSCTSNVF